MAPKKTDEEKAFIRSCVVTGCNFPPSQFQLHIQYFLMPWVPFQYRLFLDGGALGPKRWFPLKYVKEVLALNEPIDVKHDTPLAEIFAKYDAKVSYDAAFEHELARVGASHRTMANWRPADFAVAVRDDEIVEVAPPVAGQTAKQLVEGDKAVLHSKGPVLTYYKHARTARVPEFGEAC